MKVRGSLLDRELWEVANSPCMTCTALTGAGLLPMCYVLGDGGSSSMISFIN